MRALVGAISLCSLLLAPLPVQAEANLRVSYLVDARALRSLAPLRDVLVFELYADAACTQALHLERVSALRVSIARAHVRPAANGALWVRRRRAATLTATLHPVPARARSYLRVRGPAVQALGSPCQLQEVGL